MISVVKDSSGATPPSASPWQVFALVAIPVFVCAILAVATLWVVGMMAFLSAMGHGRLTREEALPFFIGGGLVTLAGTAATVRLVERRVFGPARERARSQAEFAWRTRAASLVIIVAIAAGGPPLARAVMKWREASIARHGSDEDRWSKISDLAFGLPSAESRDTLQAIATDTSDDPKYRALAASGLHQYPESKPVLTTLAKDPHANVRAAAGSALVWLADDPATWTLIEELALRDSTLLVRQEVAAALSRQTVDASRAADRQRILSSIAASGGAPEALAAATGIGGGAGYDAAMAIVMDPNQLRMTRAEAIESLGVINDPRALDVLTRILKTEMDPGFVPPEMDGTYRSKAAGAYAKLAPGDDPSLSAAYSHEQWALPELKTVVDAQLKYREATGFFDARLACLELVATCVRGRDRDESLLGPVLASLMPHRGYARQLHPGPPVPQDQIAARNASATSVTSFAYVAVPESPFDTGIRGFCVDDSGQSCYTRDGSAPAVRGGRCPASKPVLADQRAVDFYDRPLMLECASR